MTDTLHAPLPLFYPHTVVQDSLWERRELLYPPVSETAAFRGMDARPVPQTLMRTDGVTIVLLLSLLLILLIRLRYRSSFAEAVKSFVFPPNSAPSSPGEEAGKERLRAVAGILLSLECSVFVFAYLQQHIILLVPSLWYLLLLAAVIFVFLVAKQFLYRLVNSTFFSTHQRWLWRNNYSFLLAAESLLLFPFLLLYIYLPAATDISLYAVVFLLVFVKIWLLLKGFSIFFEKIHGLLHLFVYLCALEAAPTALLYAFITQISNCLTTL